MQFLCQKFLVEFYFLLDFLFFLNKLNARVNKVFTDFFSFKNVVEFNEFIPCYMWITMWIIVENRI